jgi:hypothetical protein
MPRKSRGGKAGGGKASPDEQAGVPAAEPAAEPEPVAAAAASDASAAAAPARKVSTISSDQPRCVCWGAGSTQSMPSKGDGEVMQPSGAGLRSGSREHML